MMKKNLLFVLLAVLFTVAQSCTKENFSPNLEPPIAPQLNSFDQDAKSASDEQIIIRFDFDYTEAKKATLRTLYSEEYNFELNYVWVSPWDNKLELWSTSKNVQSTYIDLEDLITKMKTAEFDEGDLEEGRNSYVAVPAFHDVFIPGTTSTMNDHLAQGDGLKIAIIDSGLDYDEFAGNFLYDTSADGVGNEIISGWDFVNNDNDIRDDHGHGTNLVKIMNEVLTAEGIHAQYLMLKAFGENGEGTLFNVLNALAYVNAHPEIDVLNLSLGWYGKAANFVVLNELIDEISQNTLIICSAGNEGWNTDLSQNYHYPSGFANPSILSVGGFVEGEGGATIINNKVYNVYRGNFSNYGKVNVDLAAPFTAYNVSYSYMPKGKTITGTSYSASYVSARAGILFEAGGTISTVRQTLLKYECLKSPSVGNHFAGGRVLLRE